MDFVALAIDGEAVAVTHRTRAPGTYDPGGRWVPGAVTDTTIQATIQPVSGRQVEDLPEGVRTEARSLLWTRTIVKDDDVIIDGTASYRVLYVWDRHRDGGFTKAALGLTA